MNKETAQKVLERETNLSGWDQTNWSHENGTVTRCFCNGKDKAEVSEIFEDSWIEIILNGEYFFSDHLDQNGETY